MENTNSNIRLQPMRPMHDAFVHDDNWTGLTDAKTRRKLQNRLNQRARRRRKLKEAASKDLTAFSLANPMLTDRASTKAEAGNPHPFVFPLSLDHLLTLVQFNAFRGLVTNMKILSIPDLFYCDGPPNMRVVPLPLPNTMPAALVPTSMQHSVPHYPWIDVFPLPALRDNLIQVQEIIDTCDLCDDVLGAMWDDQLEPHDERNGLVVWGEPWDVNSWELMEGFAQKWGWMLAGCPELIEATNKWRVLRGEEPFSYRDVISKRPVHVVS